jgi:hypothetical protein
MLMEAGRLMAGVVEKTRRNTMEKRIRRMRIRMVRMGKIQNSTGNRECHSAVCLI